MSVFLGISGAKRNACAAICVDGEIRAVCEQERLTRIRGIGLAVGTLPVEAVNEVLELSNCRSEDVTAYVVAEPDVQLPGALPVVRLDHHQAHAATAFLTSPFHQAAVLVCDGHPDRDLSVWAGHGTCFEDRQWPWRGPAFATLYSECAALFGSAGHGHAHEMEISAHLGQPDQVEQLNTLFRYRDGALELESGWQAYIAEMIRCDRRQSGHAANAASAVQRRIGEMLLDFLSDVRAAVETDALCLAGGLFYNTYLTTLVRTSGIFTQTFVPINPGNAGIAVGAALLTARQNGGAPNATAVSPFLGREYDAEATKAALEGCKLSYEFVTETEAQEAAVAALVQGQLVGWFQGRMEWGHRALGHRSILADPCSRYVLDNLNFFLRKRDRSRPFGVAVREETVQDLFCGPAASPFMEYQYRPRDDRFRHIMPSGATAIRVQTAGPDTGPFWSLLKKMEQATGTGALVNTSFNGFHEPIVASHRDAIRVFFGTGLDMLVIGRFILRK